jgi:protein SCO1/2
MRTVFFIITLGFTVLAFGQAPTEPRASIDDTRPIISEVGVDEKRGEQIDLSLTFTDRHGKEIRLDEIIKGDVPVILAPVYYNCPSLCTMVLNGASEVIDGIPLRMGKDYRVINVSFNPEDTPELAAAKSANYLNALETKENVGENWFWLTGSETAVAELMDQIGFRYKKIDQDYSHSSTLVILSPKGMISKYFYGVVYPAQSVRFALVDAAEGRIGTTMDQILMYCFRFDPQAGKYVPYAWGIMRIGGVLTLIGMSIVGFLLWKLEFTERRRL